MLSKARPSSNKFISGKRLHPKDVYCTVIGAFKEAKYELIQVFFDELHWRETARIYKKNEKKYILYYPGKDNNQMVNTEKTIEPLSSIINKSHKAYQKLNSNDFESTADIHQLFIVSEYNYYSYIDLPWIRTLLRRRVAHYVKADSDGNTLTVEDSMARNYSIKGIMNAVCPPEVEIDHESFVNVYKPPIYIKRGWQKIYQTWQCAHYVIASISRHINDEKAPVELEINDSILGKHSKLFTSGFASYDDENKKYMDTIVKKTPHRAYNDNLNFSMDDDSDIDEALDSFEGSPNIDDKTFNSSISDDDFSKSFIYLPNSNSNSFVHEEYTDSEILTFSMNPVKNENNDKYEKSKRSNFDGKEPTNDNPLFKHTLFNSQNNIDVKINRVINFLKENINLFESLTEYLMFSNASDDNMINITLPKDIKLPEMNSSNTEPNHTSKVIGSYTSTLKESLKLLNDNLSTTQELRLFLRALVGIDEYDRYSLKGCHKTDTPFLSLKKEEGMREILRKNSGLLNIFMNPGIFKMINQNEIIGFIKETNNQNIALTTPGFYRKKFLS